MRADLGLVDVAWEEREEHNNRARLLAEEQNREINALNDEFSEVVEGASATTRSSSPAQGRTQSRRRARGHSRAGADPRADSRPCSPGADAGCHPRLRPAAPGRDQGPGQ
jgi:hypothetical protein